MKKIILILFVLSAMAARGQYPSFMPEFHVMSVADDIRAHTAQNGAVALLRGVDTVGDGFGGLFQYNALSLIPDDGFNTFKPTLAGTGRWLRMSIFTIPGDTTTLQDLIAGYGLLPVANYNGSAPVTHTVDTSLLATINYVNQITNITSNDIAWSVDTIACSPSGFADGAKVLVCPTGATGAFTGFEDSIATLTGGIWNFEGATVGDLLEVTTTGTIYKLTDTGWLLIKIAVLVGGNRLGMQLRAGTKDANDLNLITKDSVRLRIDTTGRIFVNNLKGLNHSHVAADSATGLLYNVPDTALEVHSPLYWNTARDTLFVDTTRFTAGVASWSAGTTGFTPNTATTGAVTLAGTLNETHGGTNQTTYTTGDILYASASNTLSKLPIGTTRQTLHVVGGIPAWRDTTAVGAGGITSLNGLTDATQTFATGTAGTDFNIVSATGVHTFNIPDANGTTARGLVSTGDQTFGGVKSFSLAATVGTTSRTFRTTSAGANINAVALIDIGSSATAAGSLGVAWDNTTGFQNFTAANGLRRVSRAYIGITNLVNTNGSESADLVFGTQAAGAAATEKFRISSGGLWSLSTVAGTANQIPVVNAGGTAMTWISGTGSFWSLANGGTLTGNNTITGGGLYTRFSGGRLQAGQGAAIAAANDLTLGNDGNTFSITGATQINAITTTNWQAGSVVNLIFTSTPTVKNNTAGGAGTAVILLASSADFVAAANDVLTLVYDGSAWHETSRKQATVGGQFWALANGGTLTGVNTITSSRPVGLIFNGTYTTTANNQYFQQFNPTITARATTSDVIIGTQMTPTIAFGANSQEAIALDIAPTFTIGGFTSTQSTAIRAKGDITPSVTGTYNVGISTKTFVAGYLNTWNGQTWNSNGANNLFINQNGSKPMTVLTATQNLKFGSNTTTADSLYKVDVNGEIKSQGSMLVAQLPAAVITTVTNQGTAGATTYTYKIVRRDVAGNTSGASAAVSTTTGNATLSPSNFNRVSWSASEVNSLTHYYVDIYRTVGGATQGKIATTSGYGAQQYDDISGAGGDGSTPPVGNTTGNVGAGTVRPIGGVDIRPSVVDAGGATMFFRSGGVSAQTTQIAGQFNYDGTDLYLSDGTRNYTIGKGLVGSATLDFGSIAGGGNAELTITVTGVADGDAVALGTPNGSFNAGIIYTARCSAANTVTVDAYNITAGAIDPASGTFKVRVAK